MTQVPPAAYHPDVRAPDRFLRDVEPRALQMAELALTRRAAALEAVEGTMRAFATRHDTHAEGDWPLLFWSLLDGDLDKRLRVLRPRWRTWFARRVQDADADDPRAALPDPASPGPFMQLPDAKAMTALEGALRALPMRQRQAFLLRVREELDVAGSARVLHLSESVVRTQLFRALRNLRTRLRTHAASPAGQDSRHDGAWILRCRALLDDAARDLDAATLARLTLARQAALAAPAPRRGRWLVRAGGLAIVAGAALVLSRLLPPLDVPPPPAAPPPIETDTPPPPPPRIAPSEDTPLAAPDFDLLLDADDETLLEDLAFYAWLAAEEPR